MVAQIAVVAIVVYFTYSAVAAAVPTDVHSPSDVFEVTEDFLVNSETDGMNMTVTITGAVATKLPQNLEGVYINVYLGEHGKRTEIAHGDIGSIKAKDTTSINIVSNIPAYTILAYAITNADSEGNITVPMVLSFGFKYMEWYGVYLVDLGLDIKQNLQVAAGVDMPEAGPGIGDSSAKVTVVVDRDAGDTINGVAKSLLGGASEKDFSLTTSNGASIDIKLTKVSEEETGITLNAAGAGEKSAVDLLKEAVGEEGLTLRYNDTDYTISKENAATFIELMTELYVIAGVDP